MATKPKAEVFNKSVSTMIAMHGLIDYVLDQIIVDKICFRNSVSKGKTNRISKAWLLEVVISAGFTKEQFFARWSYYLDRGLISQEVYEGWSPVQLSVHNSGESATKCAKEPAPVKTTKVSDQTKPTETKEEFKEDVEVFSEELTLVIEKPSASAPAPEAPPVETKTPPVQQHSAAVTKVASDKEQRRVEKRQKQLDEARSHNLFPEDIIMEATAEFDHDESQTGSSLSITKRCAHIIRDRKDRATRSEAIRIANVVKLMPQSELDELL
jgi:hypothetical protein